MSRLNILLDTHFRRLENVFTAVDLARLQAVGEVLWGRDVPLPPDELSAMRDDVEVIITGGWRHGAVADYPRLKTIIEVAGGFPSPHELDYATCFTRGIRVLSCAPAFGPAVAEMGLALALNCARQVTWTDGAIRRGGANWSHSDFDTPLGTPFTLYGRPVGFIGYGGLARALQPLLAPFNCPIQAYDPWLTDTYLRRGGVTPVDLDTLLSTSRIIFVLAVSSDANRAMLDREKLSLIQEDAVFVLLSRAHVVDFDVLTEMVGDGRFRAAVDVYPEEPFPADHPLCRAPGAILSAHRAGAIDDALKRIGRLVADDVEAIAHGLVPHALQHAQPEFIQLRGAKGEVGKRRDLS